MRSTPPSLLPPPIPESRRVADLRGVDPTQLSDAELLAIILGLGLAPAGSLARAVALLKDHGGLSGLGRAGHGSLSLAIGARRSALLVAALTLGKRGAEQASATPARLGDSAAVNAWASPRIASLEHEELWLLALDGKNGLRAARCLARGGMHGLSLAPKDVLVAALREGARSFILVHNHPSGDPTPSEDDVVFTREVAEAAAIVGAPLLDHVVVGRCGFASVPFTPAPRKRRQAPPRG